MSAVIEKHDHHHGKAGEGTRANAGRRGTSASYCRAEGM